ncbi:NAD(P)H-binding protein [Stenotrophomonas maltophilia]|uniref:NAD(P)H-binding protein n=1 Tax=Stenotrophomonas maltophilia TaxID=40324 RepID=UPI0034DAE590
MADSAPLKILLTGATGLVGQGVARACLASPHVARTVALVRSDGALDARIDRLVLADFRQAATLATQLAGFDACFYCAGAPPLGTAEALYRQVTVDATVAVAAAWAVHNPQGRFLYVSGAHADPRSRIMPLRVKGEVEAALAQLPVRSVMLRPAGVRPVAGTGSRHALLQPLYRVGGPLMSLAGRALPALVTSNETIGRAMIALALASDPPPVLECAQINRWGAGSAH